MAKTEHGAGEGTHEFFAGKDFDIAQVNFLPGAGVTFDWLTYWGSDGLKEFEQASVPEATV